MQNFAVYKKNRRMDLRLLARFNVSGLVKEVGVRWLRYCRCFRGSAGYFSDRRRHRSGIV